MDYMNHFFKNLFTVFLILCGGLRFIDHRKCQQKGGIMVEYALLLIVCVGMALALGGFIKFGGDESSRSTLINKWIKILEIIAQEV